MIVQLRCRECDVYLGDDIEFEPDVPPKPCMDPDHPAYSDPGSIGYCEGYPETCPGCGWKVDEQYVYDQARAAWADKLEADYEDYCERKYEDSRDK